MESKPFVLVKGLTVVTVVAIIYTLVSAVTMNLYEIDSKEDLLQKGFTASNNARAYYFAHSMLFEKCDTPKNQKAVSYCYGYGYETPELTVQTVCNNHETKIADTGCSHFSTYLKDNKK